METIEEKSVIFLKLNIHLIPRKVHFYKKNKATSKTRTKLVNYTIQWIDTKGSDFLFPLCFTVVHPNHYTDHLHEPERLSGFGYALHAQGLRDHLSPRTERPETQAQL